MKRLLAAAVSSVMVLGGLVGLAPQAAASTIWDFPQSTFTIKDSLGATASVVVTNLRVVDGAARGSVNVNGGRYTCQSGSFSGLEAQFTVDRFSPCYGSIWFDVSPSGVLTLSATNLNGSGQLFAGAGDGSSPGTDRSPKIACTAPSTVPRGGAVDVAYTVTNPPAGFEVSINAGGQVLAGSGTSGTVTTQPLVADTSITCELRDTASSAVVATSSLSVSVPAPSMTCSVSPSPSFKGDTLTISWSVTNPPAGAVEANVFAGNDFVTGSSKEVNAAQTSGSVTHVPTGDTTYRCALFSGGQALTPPVEGTASVQLQALPSAPVAGPVVYGDIMAGTASPAPFQGFTLSAGSAPAGWTPAWSRNGSIVVPPPTQQCGTTESYTPLWVRGSLSVVGAKPAQVAPPCSLPTPSVAGAVITRSQLTVNYAFPSAVPPGTEVRAVYSWTGGTDLDRSLGPVPASGLAGSATLQAIIPAMKLVQVRVYAVLGTVKSGSSSPVKVRSEAPPLSYPGTLTGVEGETTASAVGPKTLPLQYLAANGARFSAINVPRGIRVDPTSGRIEATGDPLQSGSGTITVTLRSPGAEDATAPALFAIAPAPPGPGDFTYPSWTAPEGVPVFLKPRLSVPFPSPRYFYSPDLCANAPGLTLGNTSGVIQGATTLQLPATVAVAAYDKPGGDPCVVPTGARLIARAVVKFTVAPPQAGQLAITYAQDSVTALVGSPVNDVPTVRPPGLPGVTFAVTSGVLPAGLVLDAATGAITGVPTTPTPVDSHVTVTARFRTYPPAEAKLTFSILPLPTGSLSGLSYPNVVAAPATVSMSVLPAGAVTGQTFSLDRASVAAGMTIDAATGRITWTPSAAQRGIATVTVTVTANGTSAALAPFTITVVAAPATSRPVTTATTGAASAAGASTGGTGGSSGSAGSGQPEDLCLAPNGFLYSDIHGSVASTLTVAPNTTGMPAPESFIVTGGSLPRGVWLDGVYGIISGTPERSNGGHGPVEITTTWPDGTVRVSDFMIAIDDPHHAVNYANRIIGSMGEPVTVTPFEVNVVGATTYQLVCGGLPPGLAMDAATGVISGTPTGLVGRPVPLRVRMSDSYGWVDSSFIFVVDEGVTPWLRYPEFAEIGSGRTVRIVPTRSGLPATDSYRITGDLPPGLSLNKKTGVISGVAKVRDGYVYEPTITAIGKDGRPQATTVPSMTVIKPAVPMKVTARTAAKRLKSGATIVVTKVRHPAYSSLSARVVCSGCTHTFNKKSGRLVVKTGKKTTRVRITITASPRGPKARAAYAGHQWTRTWRVAR